MAAPALIEAYAVLTRLPPPHRVSPRDALTLLDANFIVVGRTIALDGREYRALLRSAPDRAIVGGRVYDALIAECALRGKADVLLTFNTRHFASFARPGLDIVVPQGTRAGLA